MFNTDCSYGIMEDDFVIITGFYLKEIQKYFKLNGRKVFLFGSLDSFKVLSLISSHCLPRVQLKSHPRFKLYFFLFQQTQ